MKRAVAAALVTVAVLGSAAPAMAHGIHSEVERREAVVVTLTYADGTPFAGQPFEVRAAGSQGALVTGETDPRGRAVFLPVGEGPWRLQARSPGGHGATVKVAAAAGDEAEAGGEMGGKPAAGTGHGHDHAHARDSADGAASGPGGSRAILGLGIILAAFGAWALWRCRRQTG